jgi:hypothetical protein
MAQMSSVKNKQKREALLQQANALLAGITDAPAKKNKKKINEEEHEAVLAELTVDAPTNYELSIHAPKPKPTKKAQVNELDRMLANCTVQRFADCSVPSNLSQLSLSPPPPPPLSLFLYVSLSLSLSLSLLCARAHPPTHLLSPLLPLLSSATLPTLTHHAKALCVCVCVCVICGLSYHRLKAPCEWGGLRGGGGL